MWQPLMVCLLALCSLCLLVKAASDSVHKSWPSCSYFASVVTSVMLYFELGLETWRAMNFV